MEKNPPSTEVQNGPAIQRKTGFPQVEEMVKALTHEERRPEAELQRENPVENERHEHLITELKDLIHSKKMVEKHILRHKIREQMVVDKILVKLDPFQKLTTSETVVHLLEEIEEYRKQAVEDNHRVLQVERTCWKLSKHNEALILELQEHECRKASQLEKLADLQKNLVFGSYSDEFANPVRLNQALEAAQDAITKFSNQWFDCLIQKSGTSSAECQQYAGNYFAREKHISYAVKADVSKGLFKHFEREDFGTGVNLYLDPEVRRTKCLEYIHHSNLESSEHVDTDDEFRAFFRKRCFYMHKTARQHLNGGHVSRLDSLVCYYNSLEPDFKAAARRVWFLHKLAFAFEPPARILRVAGNVGYDQHFMKPVVTFADDDNFIPKVGFMIAPGFYLGKTTIKAEIYLAGNKKSP